MIVLSLHWKSIRLRSLMTNAKSVEAYQPSGVPAVEVWYAYDVAGEENMSQRPCVISCRKDLSQCCRKSSETERLSCVWQLQHNRPLRMTALEARC